MQNEDRFTGPGGVPATGWILDTASGGWSPVRLAIESHRMCLVAPGGSSDGGAVSLFRGLPHTQVVRLDELAPFDRDPLDVEVRLEIGETVTLRLPRLAVDAWRELLIASSAAETSVGHAPRRRRPVRWRFAGLSMAVCVVVLSWLGVREAPDPVAADPTTATVHDGGSPATELPTRPSAEPIEPARRISDEGDAEDPTVSGSVAEAVADDVDGGAQAPPGETSPQPDGAIAPLTGLWAERADLERAAIVSKIDASLPAMPQVGLELADVVYEVKVEGMSRYLAVFHSRQPWVIGPHRSARTSDPDLLSMFGHPLFAFSGANPGVVQTLAESDWKTGVGPGEVGHAYFRDEGRPWPHNLFAVSEHLRSRPSPPAFPSPIVEYHPLDRRPPGVPVGSFTASAGTGVQFRWDPDLRGWRRRIWDTDHLHATGAPVAPTNVVVVRTEYTVSHADANSPEAVSVGGGPAWVFTRGELRTGTWSRAHRSEPWNLRDPRGAALTLDPGTTWVVLADRDPLVGP